MHEEGRPGHRIVFTVAAIGFLMLFVLAFFAAVTSPDEVIGEVIGPSDIFSCIFSSDSA